MREIKTKVRLSLEDDDVAGGIGLLDLYGPTFYPPGKSSADERYTWAKKHLEDHVGNGRFRQHFAVHEVEAWLLAQPGLLPAEVRKKLPGKHAHPETVNFDEPPAKLLERLYSEKLKKPYKKVVDGFNLFSKLEPGTAAAKCPRLKALLIDALHLAKGP